MVCEFRDFIIITKKAADYDIKSPGEQLIINLSDQRNDDSDININTLSEYGHIFILINSGNIIVKNANNELIMYKTHGKVAKKF
jgi:uncharacterized membrane protein YjjP (DUF1212 family)